MKKIVFIVERTHDGYSAFALKQGVGVGTTGHSMIELKNNIVDAYNTYAEAEGIKEIKLADIVIRLDIHQFFDFYKVINASALGNRIGMDKTLISQYVNGYKKPGTKQIDRIIKGIKELGEELSSLELAK